MSASERFIQVMIQSDPPNRLDKAIARDIPEGENLSRSRLAKLINDGAVKVNGEVITTLRHKVNEGAEIEITVPVATDSHMLPEDIPLEICYEDEDLLVVNKPAGMVVHPAPGSPSGTLVNALLHHFGDQLSGVGGEKRPGIVHRIDKDTSGLLVIAKSDAAHQGLAAQFERHSVKRRYIALVYGVPDHADPRLLGVKGINFEGANILKITTQLARHKNDRQRQAVVFSNGRHAVTRARTLETFGTPAQASIIECWLETGRTHQIRVHMTHAGHSLLGDQTYGNRRKLKANALSPDAINHIAQFPRQALHAASLGFIHPVSQKEMNFDAALPEDMTRLTHMIRSPAATLI